MCVSVYTLFPSSLYVWLYFEITRLPPSFLKDILVNFLLHILGDTKPMCPVLPLLPHPATSPQYCYARNVTGVEWLYDSEATPGIDWEWRQRQGFGENMENTPSPTF